jgi:hypothetical protein
VLTSCHSSSYQVTVPSPSTVYTTYPISDRSRLPLIGTHSYKLGQSVLTVADPIEATRIQDRSRLLLWICELLYASSIAFCKLSILCFYWRVFQYTSIRYAIIGLLIAVSIWITIRTFMVIFHCVPIRAYWDKSIQGAKCPFNEANFFFATILIHTTMDCVILILPVIEVMKMTLPLSQKLAVVGLFTSGTMYVEVFLGISWSNVVQSLRCIDFCFGAFKVVQPSNRRHSERYGTEHDVGSCRDKYGGFLRYGLIFILTTSSANKWCSLSSYATTYFSSFSPRTLDNRRVSPSADQFTKRCPTRSTAYGNEIKETGVS